MENVGPTLYKCYTFFVSVGLIIVDSKLTDLQVLIENKIKITTHSG